MVEKKISNITDEFDFRLFLRVAKKNSAWIVLFFIIAFLMAFLYLRYTYPKYKAFTTIQISVPEKSKKIIPVPDQGSNDMASKIALLKSSRFLYRVFNKMPLEIGYYQIGNVLNYEMYRTSPFEIEFRSPIVEIYNNPIYVSFTDENNYSLTLNVNNKETVFRLKSNKWERTPVLDSIKLNVRNYSKIRSDMKGLNQNQYYFILSKRENLVRSYSPFLEIIPEDEAAGSIKISFVERNASKSADICNTLAEEFLIYDVEKQAESSTKTLEFIDEQLKTMYDKLYDSEKELQEFKSKNKLNEDIPLPDFSSRLNDLEKQRNDLELEDAAYETIQDAVQDDRNIDVYSLISLLTGTKISNTEIGNLLGELRRLLSSREALLYSKTQNSASIAQLDFQINIQRKLIIETILALKKNNYNQKQEIEQRIENYENEIRENALSFDRLEYIRLQKMNEISSKYYNKLVEVKSELTITNAGITSESTILNVARTPQKPFEPSRRTVAFGAFTGWFLASLILVIARYLFHNDITSINEITKYLDVPILGIVPNYRDVIPISQLLVDKKPKSIISESLRSIRSNLEFLSNTEGPKVLAITSTISGEGKTFVALNLAGIIAFSEKKVIIIDLDMRKPKIHVGFGVPNDKGMSTILINRHRVDECIYKSSLENLDFITAGPVPPNPSELIISSNMTKVLDELKKEYDMIVIDNPPIGLVTDGIRIFKIADYPIYVFRENYSKRNFVQNVRKIIKDHGIKNISAIMNAVDIKKSGYGYSGVYDYDYGYGYGYGFGYYDEDIRREKFSIKEFFRKLISK